MAAVLGMIAVLAGCGRGGSQARDPEAAAEAFFAAVEKGDERSAYDGASFSFQAAHSFDAFLSNARELGIEGGQPPVWKQRDIRATEARLDGTLMSQAGGQIEISVTLRPDGGTWKVISLDTGTGSEQAGNRFTLIGKGVGFNDVYHQPMPDSQQLTDLIHETLTEFNTAVQTGDFHKIYVSASQQWKDGQRMDGSAAAGMTENMLKTHFQQFTDMKLDLSGLARMPPVYDRPPLIGQDGLLGLHGHFDLPPYRVHFFLQYAYELPRWKLFGIYLSLTK
jgi:hypothetical protein